MSKLRNRLPKRLTVPMDRVGERTDIRLGAPNDARERRNQRAVERTTFSVPKPPSSMGVTTVRSASSNISAGSSATITASCLDGEVLTGGGCYTGASPALAVSCRSSYPNTPNQQWVSLVSNGSAGSVTAVSYAICVESNLQQ